VSVTGQLAGGPPYFRGVLVELVGVGEGYVLLETAVGTGNRLLRFASESPDLAYALFEAELGSRG
jgi:ubiquinone/menaquinone biosynthesis C-methylase UbiE